VKLSWKSAPQVEIAWSMEEPRCRDRSTCCRWLIDDIYPRSNSVVVGNAI